jgi:sulfoxide reductase heme-binding subunit YedZ
MVMRDTWIRWGLKPLIMGLGLLPFGLLLWGALRNDLGANPLEAVTHGTGDWALRFLLITLAMTPLRRLLGHPWPLRVRRMLGLFAFFYATLHFLTWLVLDQELLWQNIANDIAKRPYITVGFAAWLMLLPLALTSTRGMMRRLGRHWSRLHRLVYPIAILGVLHYAWLVKQDLREPLIYGVLLAGLLLMRWRPGRSALRARLGAHC